MKRLLTYAFCTATFLTGASAFAQGTPQPTAPAQPGGSNPATPVPANQNPQTQPGAGTNPGNPQPAKQTPTTPPGQTTNPGTTPPVQQTQPGAGTNPGSPVPAKQTPSTQPGAGTNPAAPQSANQNFQRNTVNQTPFFTSPSVRQQLNFTDQQYNALSDAYKNAYSNYTNKLNGLSPTLTDAQRAQQMQTLRNDFYRNLDNGIAGVITDPTARARLNQLNWQYRGYDAFNDPTISQKLNLTQQQNQQLQQFQLDWNNSMGNFQRDFQTDPTGAMQRYNTWRTQETQRLNNLLTPEQRTIWSGVTGDMYSFPPSVYFPMSSGSTSGNGTTTIK